MESLTPEVMPAGQLPVEQQVKPDREQLFIEALSQCKTVKEAGLKAGYSESYSIAHVHDKFKDPKFLDRVKQYYNGHATVLLPKIIGAEAKAVELVLQDPELLPKYRHTLKELKQSAGVLSPDVSVVNQTLNYVDLRGTLTRARVDQDAIDVTPGN